MVGQSSGSGPKRKRKGKVKAPPKVQKQKQGNQLFVMVNNLHRKEKGSTLNYLGLGLGGKQASPQRWRRG